MKHAMVVAVGTLVLVGCALETAPEHDAPETGPLYYDAISQIDYEVCHYVLPYMTCVSELWITPAPSLSGAGGGTAQNIAEQACTSWCGDNCGGTYATTLQDRGVGHAPCGPVLGALGHMFMCVCHGHQ